MSEDTTAATAFTGPGCLLVGGVPRRHEELSACTKVPPERIGEFLDWSSAKLHRQTRQVSRILVRFANAVLDSMESARAADEFVRSLDLAAISRDHDWRLIFCAIRDARETDSDFRHQALVKYLQYLSFRKRLLEFIYVRRFGLEETATYSGMQGNETMLPNPPEGEAGTGEGDRAFRRLPLGESVEVALDARRTHKLVLAGYALYLQGVTPPTLADKQGTKFPLRPGRNLIGRHPESDIALDPCHSAISRAHLVLFWDGAEQVSVTDLSSTGTWLRVDETRHRIPPDEGDETPQHRGAKDS